MTEEAPSTWYDLGPGTVYLPHTDLPDEVVEEFNVYVRPDLYVVIQLISENLSEGFLKVIEEPVWIRFVPDRTDGEFNAQVVLNELPGNGLDLWNLRVLEKLGVHEEVVEAIAELVREEEK